MLHFRAGPRLCSLSKSQQTWTRFHTLDVERAASRQAGADLGAADNEGNTPAFMAAQNGHREVLEVLRQAGGGEPCRGGRF